MSAGWIGPDEAFSFWSVRSRARVTGGKFTARFRFWLEPAIPAGNVRIVLVVPPKGPALPPVRIEGRIFPLTVPEKRGRGRPTKANHEVEFEGVTGLPKDLVLSLSPRKYRIEVHIDGTGATPTAPSAAGTP